MGPASARSTVRLVTVVAAASGLTAPIGLGAQAGSDGPVSPADSAALVEEMRERQADFERFRGSRIPVKLEEPRNCDERIGRFCIWFGGEGEADFPPEPPETERARATLIGHLARTAERIRDPGVTGRLVHYLVEHGDLVNAERVATGCPTDEAWWCSALLGYALHVAGEFVRAEVAFEEAMAAMPDDEYERWLTPRYLMTAGVLGDFERQELGERERLANLYWRLSDPLFLLQGNDRFTDHFARLVQVRNYEDAGNPHGLSWEEDMEETLVRYGREIGWSRSHAPGQTFGFGGIRDTRRVLGHHHPMSRGYLFPEAFLESPSDVPPESWITAPRESRSWYAPPYAPDFRALETQVGRFRRGDEMLVVGAYTPALPTGEATVESLVFGADPEAGEDTPVEAGLFLVPVDGGRVVQTRGGAPTGVFTLLAEPGRYVSSLEVLETTQGRAWRARQGVHQEPLLPGLIGVSDLLILETGAAVPESLDDAIPHVRRGVRVRNDERFAVVWEVYGLAVAEPVQVTLGFTRGRPGFLARVGEFVGILEPDRQVEIAFEDQTPDQVQSLFRAITLELPDLEPGAYTLHLRLDLVGREPVVTSRPIVVEG